MRRFLLFLLSFFMAGMTRGQTGYHYHYWFDNNYSTQREGFSATPQWHLEAELEGLDESVHAIHVQVTDKQGINSPTVTRFFLKPRNEAIERGFYWFDSELDVHQATSTNGPFILDVSKLADGFHTLNYQVMGDDGAYSNIMQRHFYKMLPVEAMSYRCWVDDDFSTLTSGIFGNAPFLVDVSSVEDGYHVLHIQLEGNAPTPLITKPFIKIPQTDNVDYLTCLFLIDGKIYKEENLSPKDGIVNWELDVSELNQGFHQAQIQVITPSGAATNVQNISFFRTTTHEEMGELYLVYSVDGSEYHTATGNSGEGVFHCNLDMSLLDEGLHRISYMLTNGKGINTEIRTQHFMKIPMGGYGINRYLYWINENEDQKHDVTLEQRVNPLHLMNLLPVETQPIRSSNFKFAVKNNQPIIYARNELHLRFYDVSGSFTETTREYVDEQVSETVEPVGELQATQTFEKIADNDIRWYWFDAEAGDSLTFRTSQATNIRLFSPTGDELYSTSGSMSVEYGGCHTWETGIHYLALHNVTGSRPTITLDYEHIDKYAILSHIPDVAGNIIGNQFKIHLVGNGLDKLVGASLVHGHQTLFMDSIIKQSIAKADICFVIDKDSYEMGEYDLHLKYVDEKEKEDEIIIDKAITLEEAYYADVKMTIVDRSNMAKPFPISVTLKNEGNMSYTFIPLNIAWDNPLEISDIRFHNFYATVAMENDSAGYQPIVLTDNLLGKGVNGAVMFFFIPELRAHETIDLQLDFTAPAHTRFNMYAWTGKPLELDTLTFHTQKEMIKYRANTSNRGQNIITFGDAVQEVTGLDVMPQNVQYAGQLANVVMKTGVTIGSMQNAMGRTIGNSYADAYDVDDDTRRLIKETYEELYPEVLTPGQIIGGNIGEIVDRLMGFQRECSRNPNPDPGIPHRAHIVVPHDPNDIYGYLSEAGTHFIADSVARVNYTIEFENDTAFATASAHTIVVRDTLDSRYFELTTFQPTCVKIGEREVFLDDVKDVKTIGYVTSFLKTIDMRPEINAIAQVDGEYNMETGIASWKFQSLDPMTMEPTDDLMQGILPVNHNGTSGIGEVMFEVGVKPNKGDGTNIENRASIVFDYEEAILTPTWTNTVDAVAPQSMVTDVTMDNDTIATLHVNAEDNLSGVWYYDVYAQYGKNTAWVKVGEHVTDSLFDFRVYEDIDYGFCVMAVDSAGNVEKKQLTREWPHSNIPTATPEIPSGTSVTSEPVYDLGGRQVPASQEGILVQKGRKRVFRRK